MMLRGGGRSNRAWGQVGIDPSDLDTPIIVRKKTTTPRTGGERKPVYTPEDDPIWAKVKSTPGKTIYLAKGKSEIVDYMMTVYTRSDLTSDDQISMNGRILRIVTTPNDLRQADVLMTFHAKDVGKDNG